MAASAMSEAINLAVIAAINHHDRKGVSQHCGAALRIITLSHYTPDDKAC